MSYNIPLMKKVYEQITRSPELHYQGSFETLAEEYAQADGLPVTECKTTRCIAGWALAFTYPEYPTLDAQMEEHRRVYGEDSTVEWDDDYANAGADIMGLSYGEAQDLFFEFDNEYAIEKLKKYIENAS